MEIRLEGITKKYQRNNRKISVLDDLSLTIPNGKFALFSGDSGVGKSTLLQEKYIMGKRRLQLIMKNSYLTLEEKTWALLHKTVSLFLI